MRFTLATTLTFLCAAVSVSASAHSAHSLKRRHHLNRAHSSGGEIEVKRNLTDRSLEKRFSGARLTFYDAGLGACGKVNSNSDFIVALNIEQWDGGSHCFEQITLTANGVTRTATIMDECPGCPFGGLDLARGFFTQYAPESVGVLSGSWTFNGAGNAAPAPPPPPKTTHHNTPPPPKPTHTSPPPPPPPHTTSSVVHKTTSSTSQSHSSSAVRSSQSVQPTLSGSQSQSNSVSPTATAATAGSVPPNSDNIAQLYLAYIQMGSLAVSGAGVNNGTPV